MDLNLETLSLRTKGRATAPMVAVVEREATMEDLESLVEEKGSKPALLRRLSDRHHSLARLVATGQTKGACAAMTGFSISRVSILMGDPTFAELVQFYRSQEEKIFRGVAEKLTGIASAALDELEERLEETPEDFSVNQLLEVVKTGADRTGFGPQSTQTSVNVHLGLAERMEEARRKAQAASNIIDVTPAKAAE